MTAPLPSDEALARKLASLQARVDQLEKARSAGHLGYASIEEGMLLIGRATERHLILSKNGLIQRDGTGALLTALGVGSNGVNYLTILDEDGEPLAAIDNEGRMYASSFALNGPLTVEGSDIASLLTSAPLGTIAISPAVAASSNTTSEVGILELAHTQFAGRTYVVHTTPALARTNPCGLRIRSTDDGSIPTVSSPILQAASMATDRSGSIHVPYGATESKTRRHLLTVVAFGGLSTRVEAPTGAATGILMWVEDTGSGVTETGGANPGAGTGLPWQRTLTYGCTWSRAFGTNVGQIPDASPDDRLVQGKVSTNNHGDSQSIFGFDVAQIQADLAGATIDTVELYLKNTHTNLPDGAFARIAPSSVLAPVDAYPYTPYTSTPAPARTVRKFGRGAGLWINLGTTVGDGLRDGTIGSFVLDATDIVPAAKVDYGWWDGNPGSSNKPVLRIKFTSPA